MLSRAGITTNVGGGLYVSRPRKNLQFSFGVFGGVLFANQTLLNPITGTSHSAETQNYLLNPFLLIQDNKYGIWFRGAGYIAEENFPTELGSTESFGRYSLEAIIGLQEQRQAKNCSQFQISAGIGYLAMLPYNRNGDTAHSVMLTISMQYYLSRLAYLQSKNNKKGLCS